MNTETADFRFEPLAPEHDRRAFSCGVPALDHYLQKQARQDAKKRVAVVFVLTPDGRPIVGYHILPQYSVELEAIPEEIAKRLPNYPSVPATRIGRLAVSNAFRGQKFGEMLLMDALNRCLSGSRQVASAAVVVDVKDDQTAGFYKNYGFIGLPKLPRLSFLPMATVAKLFA